MFNDIEKFWERRDKDPPDNEIEDQIADAIDYWLFNICNAPDIQSATHHFEIVQECWPQLIWGRLTMPSDKISDNEFQRAWLQSQRKSSQFINDLECDKDRDLFLSRKSPQQQSSQDNHP